MKTVLPAIHCCTEAEAESIGIFFSKVFGQLNYWSIRVNWQKESANNPCMGRSQNNNEIISFEDLGGVALQCSKRFAQQLMQCIEGSENTYMKARCSLLVLNIVSAVFPTQYIVAEPLQRKISEKLVEKKGEVKEDLWVLASSCNENLKKKMAKMPYERAKEEKSDHSKQATK